MLSNSEEHRLGFPEPPVTAFRRCKNLKDIIVRARLTNNNNCNTRGCARCEKSRCQVCQSMSDSDSFHSHVTKKEYKINFSFNCDSSNVVYLFDCVVCGFQYVGSTSTPFRLRFNNYKACYRRFRSGSSVPKMDFFRQKLVWGDRIRDSFWQHKLDTFTPQGLNVREVDTILQIQNAPKHIQTIIFGSLGKQDHPFI